MMLNLQVNDILKDKILVSRESARLLEEPLRAVVKSTKTPCNASGRPSFTVDFQGVEGVAPSFIDELLSIFESVLGPDTNGDAQSLIIANPPTRLSSKFEAVARGHGMSVRAQPDGSWLLTGLSK